MIVENQKMKIFIHFFIQVKNLFSQLFIMETNSSGNNSNQDFKKNFEFDENIVVKIKTDNAIKKDDKKKSSEKKLAVKEKIDPFKEDPFFLS
tara:strand:+ start:223 stop:498 length:276 start_codon:yes stop_codon:yes gene_type:complete